MSQLETERTQEHTTAVHSKPQPEHEWLQKLVGEWSYESAQPQPGHTAPPKMTGSEQVRSIGRLWIVAEGQGEMPEGGLATTQMTLGYDPAKRRFVGSWIGSMMTHQWLYDGELDASGKTLTLNSEGPSMDDDGTMAKYQDVIEIKSRDRRTLTARILGKHGNWHQFMTVEYQRRK